MAVARPISSGETIRVPSTTPPPSTMRPKRTRSSAEVVRPPIGAATRRMPSAGLALTLGGSSEP